MYAGITISTIVKITCRLATGIAIAAIASPTLPTSYSASWTSRVKRHRPDYFAPIVVRFAPAIAMPIRPTRLTETPSAMTELA